ncbi:MAG: hypothetical protein RLZZ385_2765 [Pseudomonadota bacterium]|jgi:hypothetical protein
MPQITAMSAIRVALRLMMTVSVALLPVGNRALAQIEEQRQSWQELLEADARFAGAATTEGRTQAFLDVLAPGSVVFREGPVDARELYETNEYQYRLDQLTWKSHFIDVSRAGDLGLAVGPSRYTPNDGEDGARPSYGFMVGVWIKPADTWRLAADIVVRIPGYIDLDVQPDFADTELVWQETAHPVMVAGNDMQSLIDADNLFGQSINFRGGQRARLRYGLENQRLYLAWMAPAVGAEAAGQAYGRYMDELADASSSVDVRYVGGYLSASREVGFTYGVMSAVNESAGTGFRANYLRFWRFSESNEWRIALEVVSPF